MEDVQNNIQKPDNAPEDSHALEEEALVENHSGVGEEKRWPGWPGENVFRMLVPVKKVGGIIGRKGDYIKKTCEETKARIKVLECPPGITERAVMISAKEEPSLSVPPAMDGLLKVHKRIIDVERDSTDAPSGRASTRLLVAATQAAILIGKQGATIKSIQDESHCPIRVLGGEHLPVFALSDDCVVEIQGESGNVLKAVEMVAGQLRKFLVDRSVVGLFEKLMQMPNARANQNMLPPPGPTQPWGPPPASFHMSSMGPGFGINLQYMLPPSQVDNYFQPVGASLEKQQPYQGPAVYGRDSSIGAHADAQPQRSVVSKVTQNLQIPLSYADAVIGTYGSNISYIRRTSGATIAVQETTGVPGKVTVEINGSASQVQTAQQLIQNSIAEADRSNAAGPPTLQGPVYTLPSSTIADAASSAQNTPVEPPTQGYNPYPATDSVYRGSYAY